MNYVLSFDQSTQGTKAMLFDEDGRMLKRTDLAHRQIISPEGWVSHDPEEIYANVIKTAGNLIKETGIDPRDIRCIGISNQRETTAAWHRDTLKPFCDAVVWQCSRAESICRGVEETGFGKSIRERTGIPLSPFFPAGKMAWITENVPEARKAMSEGKLCLGTVDSFLVYRMTGGRSFKTDYSNASRTQLFNIHELKWDEEICRVFGIDINALPEVCDSDSRFGETDLEGLLPEKVPITGVLGDSHAALFGHGCVEDGMTKATYGTGSSIMMNIGSKDILSSNGLVTSLAWKWKGKVSYVMEGNLNYTGAVITWLKDDVGLIGSASETEELALNANPDDRTFLIPAFTGFGAPYWDPDARAAFTGMSRTTGRKELVKAALECIAYQIGDIVRAMEKDTGVKLRELNVDGGPTRNGYLMRFQSDILDAGVLCPDAEELSGIGAAYMAGMSAGLYDEKVFGIIKSKVYSPVMSESKRSELIGAWIHAVGMVLGK